MDLGSTVMDAWNFYVSFQQAHPILGSMATACGTFTLGDIISQSIMDKKVDFKKVRYTLCLAPIYGLGMYGVLESGDMIEKLIPEMYKKDYMSDPNLNFTKAALGPNVFGNALSAFFFVNNTVGEKKDYSLKELGKNYTSMLKPGKDFFKNIKEKYLSNIPGQEFAYSILGTLTAWNAIQYANYSYVADEFRTPVTLGCGVVWMSMLSLWSLVGRRKVVGSEKV